MSKKPQGLVAKTDYRFCGRCGRRHHKDESWRCRDCGNVEWSWDESPLYQGWLRRHKAKQRDLFIEPEPDTENVTGEIDLRDDEPRFVPRVFVRPKIFIRRHA